jgi:hypothetical protein
MCQCTLVCQWFTVIMCQCTLVRQWFTVTMCQCTLVHQWFTVTVCQCTLVHQWFTVPVQTSTSVIYCDNVAVHTSTSVIYCDNVPVHTSTSVQQFLATKKMAVVPHTSLIAWFGPFYFFSFLRMKLLTLLHKNPIRQFQQCFQQRQECWVHCINADRGYFEDDNNEQ